MARYKMFVWDTDVLAECGDGLVVAVARNVEEARAEIKKKIGWANMEQFEKDPDHIENLDHCSVYYLNGSG